VIVVFLELDAVLLREARVLVVLGGDLRARGDTGLFRAVAEPEVERRGT